MPTLKKYFNSNNTRVISRDDFRDRIVGYLRDSDISIVAAQYPRDGVIGSSKIAIDAGVGFDSLGLASSGIVTDGVGNILDITDSTFFTFYFNDVTFANVSGTTYEVALHYAAVPDSVQINAKTGKPEYSAWQDTVGLSGEPTSVVDNGGTITFDCANVLENGSNNNDRKVVVWKKLPADSATSDEIAIELVSVAYGNPENTITTTGTLGQTTVSTVASDYMLVALGPCVYENTVDLENTDGYAFIGTVTGNGPFGTPTAFNIDNQRLFDADATAFSDITRLEASSPNMYKVSVNANAADEATNQIEVNDQSTAPVFEVDGLGNVDVWGLGQFRTRTKHIDDAAMEFGDTSDAILMWRDTGPANPQLRLGFKSSANMAFSLMGYDDIDGANNFNSSTPALFIHDGDTVTQWGKLYHSGTHFHITTDMGSRLKLTTGGSAYVQVGATGDSIHGLSAGDDLFVAGDFEAKGNTDIDGVLTLHSATSFQTRLHLLNTNEAAGCAVMTMEHTRTAGLLANDDLGQIYFKGHDGTSADKAGGFFKFETSQVWDADSHGTEFTLYTAREDEISNRPAIKADKNGQIILGDGDGSLSITNTGLGASVLDLIGTNSSGGVIQNFIQHATGATASATSLGTIRFYGYNGSTEAIGAEIEAQTVQLWQNGPDQHGTSLFLKTVLAGDNVLSERLTINSTGETKLYGNLFFGGKGGSDYGFLGFSDTSSPDTAKVQLTGRTNTSAVLWERPTIGATLGHDETIILSQNTNPVGNVTVTVREASGLTVAATAIYHVSEPNNTVNVIASGGAAVTFSENETNPGNGVISIYIANDDIILKSGFDNNVDVIVDCCFCTV